MLGVALGGGIAGIRLAVADACDQGIRPGSGDEPCAQGAAGRIARSKKMKFVEQHGKVSNLGRKKARWEREQGGLGEDPGANGKKRLDAQTVIDRRTTTAGSGEPKKPAPAVASERSAGDETQDIAGRPRIHPVSLTGKLRPRLASTTTASRPCLAGGCGSFCRWRRERFHRSCRRVCFDSPLRSGPYPRPAICGTMPTMLPC